MSGEGSAATGVATRSRWLSCRRPRGAARTRLYCFPHSGGTAGEYLRWADDLPDTEVWGVNPPGRGGRLDEPPATDLPTLVTSLLNEVDFRAPYVLFGHSLGGIVAFEVARQLRARGRTGPQRIVLSACPPPHVPRLAPELAELPDEIFLARITDFYHGFLPGVLTDPDLVALVLPALRADVMMLERYQWHADTPVDIPLTVVGGDRDVFDPALLAEWRQHTTAECATYRLPGGHFYFREDLNRLLALLHDVLRTATP